jgi:hypothetical protein
MSVQLSSRPTLTVDHWLNLTDVLVRVNREVAPSAKKQGLFRADAVWFKRVHLGQLVWCLAMCLSVNFRKTVKIQLIYLSLPGIVADKPRGQIQSQFL